MHQMGGPPFSQRETQMLQPMHSRMSSYRPSSIFFGRNGSAMEGRAAPMMSHCPESIALRHHVRIGEPADVDDGLLRDTLGVHGVLGLVVALEEPGGACVLPPVQGADVDVPVVHHVVHALDEPRTLFGRAHAQLAVAVGLVEGVDGKAHADGAVVDGLAQHLHQLHREAAPVLERSAVLVGALVVERIEEVVGQGGESAEDGQQVEPGLACLQRAFDMVALHDADLLPRHAAGARHSLELVGDLRGSPARHPALGVQAEAAAVGQLDPGERAVLVDAVAHERQVPDVSAVDEPAAHPGRDVAVVGEEADFGEHRPPAAFRLHAAERRLHSGAIRSGPVAVRHLPEAVPESLGTYCNRLEQDVMASLSGHGTVSSGFCARRSSSWLERSGRIPWLRAIRRHGSLVPNDLSIDRHGRAEPPRRGGIRRRSPR